mmetsp:Transcript_5623/g.10538  ORF Transcript_5623/g.10538 Transcript_5623/m.10538 type:complete len:344 (-) Transcript_5623:1850-2881(-)
MEEFVKGPSRPYCPACGGPIGTSGLVDLEQIEAAVTAALVLGDSVTDGDVEGTLTTIMAMRTSIIRSLTPTLLVFAKAFQNKQLATSCAKLLRMAADVVENPKVLEFSASILKKAAAIMEHESVQHYLDRGVFATGRFLERKEVAVAVSSAKRVICSERVKEASKTTIRLAGHIIQAPVVDRSLNLASSVVQDQRVKDYALALLSSDYLNRSGRMVGSIASGIVKTGIDTASHPTVQSVTKTSAGLVAHSLQATAGVMSRAIQAVETLRHRESRPDDIEKTHKAMLELGAKLNPLEERLSELLLEADGLRVQLEPILQEVREVQAAQAEIRSSIRQLGKSIPS